MPVFNCKDLRECRSRVQSEIKNSIPKDKVENMSKRLKELTELGRKEVITHLAQEELICFLFASPLLAYVSFCPSSSRASKILIALMQATSPYA